MTQRDTDGTYQGNAGRREEEKSKIDTRDADHKGTQDGTHSNKTQELQHSVIKLDSYPQIRPG